MSDQSDKDTVDEIRRIITERTRRKAGQMQSDIDLAKYDRIVGVIKRAATRTRATAPAQPALPTSEASNPDVG